MHAVIGQFSGPYSPAQPPKFKGFFGCQTVAGFLVKCS